MGVKRKNYVELGLLPIIYAAGLYGTQGQIFHVKPYSGSDGNDGKSPDKALKTLFGTYGALAKMTEGKNDIALVYSESNTAANTTDYLSTTGTWNKDMCHIIGVNAGSPFSQRSRVAWISTYVTASNLVTVSADACLFANMAFFAGVADTNPTGCLKVTGDRNVFKNCHIAGIGHASNDIAGAYSLNLSGSEECLFEKCSIGLNTIDAGSAANSEILIDTASKNIVFDDCLIYRRIEHATNHPLVKVSGATGMDEFILFKKCGFITTATNYGYTLGGVFKFTETPTQGLVVLDNCYAVNDNAAGAGKWDVDDLDKIAIIGHPTPAADSCGLIRVV